MPSSPGRIEYAGAIVRPCRWMFVRSMRFALLGIASFPISNPAYAGDYGARDLGDWTVGASKDGKGCFLDREYAENGGTTLLLGLDIDGTNRLSVLNPNWSIKARDRLKLNFRLSDSSYPAHFAVGIVSDGKQGFVTSFGAKFPSSVAASKALSISRGTVPVEHLNLDGGAAAVAALKNCVEAQKTMPATAVHAKAQASAIPRDPFAPSKSRESKR